MSDLVFRRAGQRDLAAIVALLADDSLGRSREDPRLPLDPGYAKAFASITADSNQYLAVADRAGEIVACLQITFIPGLSRRGLWRGQIEACASPQAPVAKGSASACCNGRSSYAGSAAAGSCN
jgi:hypothetical protein